MDPRITTAARLQSQKNFPAAEQIYRQVLANQPADPDALLLLGLLLHETGRNELAVEPLRRAVELRPRSVDARQTLVAVLQLLGQLPEAIAHAREVARLKPEDAEARYAVAQLMLQARDFTGALPYARRAMELQPRSPDIFVTLSRAHAGLNSVPEAMAALDRALALAPHHGDALIDKGQLLQAQGRVDEAIALYQAGLKSLPKNRSALNNLGTCLLLKAQPRAAIPFLEAAAALSPNNPMPSNNIGVAFKELGEIDTALVHFNRAIAIDPNFAEAYCNIGGSYATIAEHDKAIRAYREALRVNPGFEGVHANLLMSVLSPPDVPPQVVFQEHVQWNHRHAAGLENQLSSPMLEISENRRIRLGYVSPDFREHSVRYFIEPVLAHHDRSTFEIICYDTGRRRDEVTDRMAKRVDAWHSVTELTDRQFAELIRSHRIDILVDLAGHTSDNRLLAFARRPAPIQITYLGYPTTTGLTAMDYRLTDSICDPPGTDVFYTEKLLRLPRAFFVYGDDPNRPIDPVLPADRTGIFTFGSFNAFTKMNDQTLGAWADILRAVPNSRLLFKARPLENPSTRQKLIAFFAQQGVPANRLDLRSWVTLPEHLAMLSTGIDLMLDTYPYNGHTTSCQSLWMGVPMVTRSGDSFRSRVGQTIMQQLDLMDFVARGWDQYIRTAIGMASDLDRLRTLRPLLRERMLASPLCDAAGFTRSVEMIFGSLVRPATA